MAEIRAIAVEAVRQRGQSDARALAERAVSGEADGTELTASQDRVPTWRTRDFSSVPIGTPYKWKGLVYKLWQQHDATEQPDWSPDLAVSLWDLCHTTDPRLAAPYVQAQGTRGCTSPARSAPRTAMCGGAPRLTRSIPPLSCPAPGWTWGP